MLTGSEYGPGNNLIHIIVKFIANNCTIYQHLETNIASFRDSDFQSNSVYLSTL